MRRRGRLLAGAVVAVVGLGSAGCGIAPESEPTTLAIEPGQPLAFPTDTATAGDATVATAPVYFVRDERLVPAERETGAGDGPAEALEALLAGPTEVEADAGLATAIPSSATLTTLVIVDRQAQVDVSNEFAAVGGSSEILAVGQIVLTLTDSGEVDSVVFAVGGVPTVVPTSQGPLTDQPVGAADYQALIGS